MDFAPKQEKVKSAQEKISPEIILPRTITTYTSREEYENMCPIKTLTDPYESTTGVSQGGFQLYEGKPLQSGAFTHCTGVILESERSLGLVHMDPNDFWRGKIKKIKKYFSDEPTKAIIMRSEIGYERPEDILYYLKECNIPVSQAKIINVDSGPISRWDMVYDPKTSTIFAHGAPDGVNTVFEYDTGLSNYSHDNHEHSKEFFESRDYMPTGFREVEKYFTQENYKINDTLFETWEREAEKSIQKELRFKKGDRLFIWTPKTGLIEKAANENDTVGQVMFPEWDPSNTLLFVATDYPEDERYLDYKGFVIGYTPDTADAAFYYEQEKMLTENEIRQRYKDTRDRSKK